ncbi:cytochrome p450 monooxygenase [Colletotrichum incanum]|uniref:Cytochrome p450 monooxygenase n=1 Tax=Colletotrichum incanum TaxID=1573173 RepID=A0A161XYN7_COLIC|nr:cytochrome p450 monooxygenase [Colletotrichum incanum]OHW97437.1 cytochrome p450 monooxygenase [Colletotrichum incanum]
MDFIMTSLTTPHSVSRYAQGVLSNVSFLSIASAVAVTFTLVILTRIIKTRFIHPLRNFPGPFINSVSSLPAAYLVYKGNQPQSFKKLHEKYGPVVRTGPNELSFIGADAWEDIYGIQKVGSNFQKDPSWLAVVSPKDGQTGLSLAPPETHTRQRNALGATFLNEALLTQEHIIQGHVDKFMQVVRRHIAENKAIDLSHWYGYATFDVIGDVIFAEPFGCLDESEETQWMRAINDIFKSGAWEQAFGQLAGVGTLLHKLMVKVLIPKELKTWRQKHLSKATEKTRRRMATPNPAHPDMVAHILKNNQTRKARLSDTEIILNMVQFISAGSETTASLLAGWTYFIIANPHVYKRVVTEVREAFHAKEDITWTSVGKLKYLEATLHEALRLTSPAPCNQHRVVPPTGQGKVIDGHYVPPGTTVAVAPWVAERHPDNFTDPEKFEPERWLGAERYKHDKLHASQPFGLGVRACIGKNLSYFEARLMMGHLLWHFDLAFDETKDAKAALQKWKTTDMLVWHVWEKPPLMVRFSEVHG